MSAQEDSLANFVTTLEAATLGGVAMTSATVHRSRPPLDPPFFLRLDESVADVNIFIEQGNTTYNQEAHNYQTTAVGLWAGVMEVYVQVALRWRVDGNPNERTINPDTQINAVIKDVIAALLPTHTRGEKARNTLLTDEGPIDATGIDEFKDWVAHEMRFQVEFEFPEDSP